VIGEELESRFFKVLGTVSSLTPPPATHFTIHLRTFTKTALPVVGLNRDLRSHVARHCCRHRANVYHGKGVLCAMPGYRFVPEKAEGTKKGREGSREGTSMIGVNDGIIASPCLKRDPRWWWWWCCC
jgi:hypothetical protein